MGQLRFIIEEHADGFIAYALGFHGVVMGPGDTYDEALADGRSAAKFPIETSGNDVVFSDWPLVNAFLVTAGMDTRLEGSDPDLNAHCTGNTQ